MTKELFIKILKNYRRVLYKIRELDKVGVNLYESKFGISEDIDRLFIDTMAASYDEFGIDWIEWFVYENEFGEKQLEAKSDGVLICQNFEDLYDYIGKYRK